MWLKLKAALPFIILFFFLAVLIIVAWKLIVLIASLKEPVAIAVVTASASVLASALAVVVGRYLERKKEIEAHFRKPKQEQYDHFLKIVFSLITAVDQVDDSDVPKQLMEWQRTLALFAGPATIRAYIDWKRLLITVPTSARSFLALAALMKAIRADLGISNVGLSDGDFAHLILRHADLFNSMIQKNPNVTLQEISEMEKSLGLEPDIVLPSPETPSQK